MIPKSFGLTLISSSILCMSTLIAAQTDNGNECSCFLTNGSSSAYFAYHRFFDFRNINSSLTAKPEVLLEETNTTDAGVSSPFFSDHAWTKDWEIQSWNNRDAIISNNATV